MKLHNRPFLIAVTGGIASGKTLVCRELEKQGFTVIYSDKIVHSILEELDIIKHLEIEFSEYPIIQNGAINRKLLGDLVFNDAEKLAKLNEIIHPEVRKEIQQLIDSSTEDYLFFEIPLLIESDMQNCFDLTVNIYAAKNVQTKRLIQNRSIEAVKAEKMISAQIGSDTRMANTDLTINNNGSLNELYAQINSLIDELDEFPAKENCPDRRPAKRQMNLLYKENPY